MRVHVDDERCKGHGMCWTIAPQVFQLTDVGYAIVTVEDVPAELEDAARAAVVQCPERAISITE